MNWLEYRFELRALHKRERDNIPTVQKGHLWPTEEQSEKQRKGYAALAIEYSALETRYWVSQAQRLHVVVPRYQEVEDENWRKVPWDDSDFVVLTEFGLEAVRNKVRAELDARKSRWLQWVVPVTGLIGTVTGLVAVLKS